MALFVASTQLVHQITSSRYQSSHVVSNQMPCTVATMYLLLVIKDLERLCQQAYWVNMS